MPASLSLSSSITLDGVFNNGATGTGRIDKFSAGSGGANGAIIPNVTLSYGTATALDTAGAMPVNDWFAEIVPVAAATTVSIDLIGSANSNPFGVALAFTHIKYFFVGIISPDGAKSLKVGPQNIANSWQGPWGGVGATVFSTVYWREEHAGPVAGWAVTADTADLFNLVNAGGASVSAVVFIAGKK